MRRILSLLLVFMLLPCGALAYGQYYAYDLALEMSEYIPAMYGLKDAPLDYGREDRVIWYDDMLDAKCALVVYGDADYAFEVSLAESTGATAVRNVDTCALYICRDLGPDVIWEYQQVLADILGVRLDTRAPDFVLNEKTLTFHTPYCTTLRTMWEGNARDYSGDYDTLLYYGYYPCTKCMPY